MKQKEMNRIIVVLAALLLTIGQVMALNQGRKEIQPISNMVVEQIAFRPFLSNKKIENLSTADFDYVPGLVALSVLRTWEQYPAKTGYYEAVKRFADNCLAGGDTIHTEPNNIDDLAAAKIFITLYREEKRRGNIADASRYQNCAAVLRDKLVNHHERIPRGLPGAGGFWHKGQYINQMWLDGLFMGAAFWAEWEAEFGEKRLKDSRTTWDDIANQFKIIHKYTYDSKVKLNYHAWSADPTDPSSFWANQEGKFVGCSPEFWGRGMGWYFAALVDVLEGMPKKHRDYNRLVRITKQVAAGLAKHQDKQTGCWYQLLQHDNKVCADGIGDLVNDKRYNIGTASNYIESSASALFIYGFYKGVRLGILNGRYLGVADRAYDGFIDNFVINDGIQLQIIQSCASAGLGPDKSPARTGTTNYYLCGPDVHITFNEGKAIGAFILASMEHERRINRATEQE